MVSALLHADASTCRERDPCTSLFSLSELACGSNLYGWIAPILLPIFVAPLMFVWWYEDCKVAGEAVKSSQQQGGF